MSDSTNKNNTESTYLKMGFTMNRKVLSQFLNNLLPNKIFDNAFEQNNDLIIKAFKAGQISLNAKGNSFFVEAPVKLNISKGLVITKAEAECLVLFAFESTVIFDKDWTVFSKTKLTEFKWLDKPDFKLGSFSLPVENIILKLIQNNSASICAAIDQKIRAELKLGDLIVDMTSKLPNPVPIAADHLVWWRIDKTNSFLAPVENEKDELTGRLGVKAELAVGIGHKIPTVPLQLSGPDLVTQLGRESEFALPLKISFLTLSFLLNRELGNRNFEAGNFTFQLSNIQSGKSGERLFASANLSGSFEGKAKVFFLPVFDTKNNELVLTNIDLEIKGSNFKTKLVAGLFKNVIENQIEQNNRFSIPYLQKIINAQIQKIILYEGLFLKTQIKKMAFENLELFPDYLAVKLTASGEMLLSLEETPDAVA